MSPPDSNPGPAYRILTSRLLIKCLEPGHARLWGVAIEDSLPHLLPWTPWTRDWPISFQERIDLLRIWRGNFDQGPNFEYGIFDSSEASLFGAAGLHLHNDPGVNGIGYWVHKDHINQGFATEVAGALTRVAFEINHVRCVEILCEPANTRSASVPRKLGFIHEATLLPDRLEISPGMYHDLMLWSLSEHNYLLRPSAKLDIQAFDAIGKRII